jgi:small subunit ribosomal protein S3
MGQKVNPIGFRVGITRPWDSLWFSEKDYQKNVAEDIQIRKFIKAKYYHAGVAKVVIERNVSKAKVFIHAAKPGVILGKRAAGLEALRADLQKLSDTQIFPHVLEVRKAETNAQLIAENITAQLEKRVSFRRAMKKSMTQAMRVGAKGIKVRCAGRLGGAEMARVEWYREGRVPLHTLRADIDYGFAEAKCPYGIIGVKIWVYNGDVGANDNQIAKQPIK